MTEKTKVDEGWDEVESPNFTEFKEYGDSVEGELVDISTSPKYGFGIYTVTKDDEKQRFHGTKQMDDLMLGVRIGDYIRIEYVDEKEMEKGKTAMKIFTLKKKRAE